MKTKICCSCRQEKNIVDFGKASNKKDGLQSACKVCKNKKHKQYYINNKEKFINSHRLRRKQTREAFLKYKKTLKCENCGFDKSPYALDFHHNNGLKKENVGTLAGSGFSMKIIMEEVKKCIVLCANCHRILHSEDNGAIV